MEKTKRQKSTECSCKAQRYNVDALGEGAILTPVVGMKTFFLMGFYPPNPDIKIGHIPPFPLEGEGKGNALLNPARESGGAVSSPAGPVEPGRQTHFSAFWAEFKASGGMNFNDLPLHCPLQ